MSDIREFQIRWKRDVFFKNRSMLLAAKGLVRKSMVIVQTRLCRQVNQLKIDLQTLQDERQILKSSLAEHLQQRLQTLQSEIGNYNGQIKGRTNQEKDYWKHLAKLIEKRTSSYQSIKPSSNTRSMIGVVHKTFVTGEIDNNDENIPPLKKIAKTRRNKKPLS